MINIGLIGYGDRGYYVPDWINKNKNCKLIALAEVDPNKISKFKENNDKSIFITNDYKIILDNPEIDTVVIMTPDYLHKDHTIASLKANKNVFIDKPLAITIEDCDRIIEALELSNGKLMVGMNMRYMTIYKTMKTIIDEGHIGDVKSIWIRHFVGRGGRFYFQDWHRNSKFTNSLLIQKGAHDFDMIHMLSDSYTKKVSAFGSLDFYNNPSSFFDDNLEHKIDEEINVEGNSVVIMELDNGIKASYLQNHFTPDYQRNYTIIGTRGRIESDDLKNEITVTFRNQSRQQAISSQIYTIKTTDEKHHDGSDYLIWNAFIDYILNDRKPNVSVIDGRMCVAVGVKATESLRSCGEIKYIN